MTRFSPWPRTRTQPAATTRATPATAIRARYGQTKRSTRASWRMSRFAGRSGRLSICLAMLEPLLERDDPVSHRGFRARLQVREAADVGGRDQLGLAGGERRELVAPQP